MSKFLVTLKPIDNFFFGGEISLRPGVSKNDKKCSYITKSNIFPQQTTILGMLRKEILINEKLYSEDWDYKDKHKVYELIGNGSFNLASPSIQDFGKIKSISPVFILKDNCTFITTPFNHKSSEKTYKPFRMDTEVETSLGKIRVPKEDFVAKNGLFSGFMNGTNGKVIEENEVFIKDFRTGIEKATNGGTEEERLYKTVSYRMNKEYCFAFNAEIDDIDFDCYSSIVSLGGEGLGFVLKASKVHEELINKIKLPEQRDFTVLLSDAYLTQEIYETCSYTISEIVDFRSIVTTYDRNEKIHRNKVRYSLLKRGSILYSDNIEHLKSLIESQKNLNKIGYNIFK